MATPPVFTIIDPVADVDALVAYYESLTGVSLHPAAVERLMLNAIAYRYSLANQAIQDAAEQNLVEFARAPALDYLGEIVGVIRLSPTPATSEVTFTLTPGHGGVTIPEGTRIATVDGQVIFVTVEDINVPALNNTATGDVECQTDGVSGNGYTTGTLTNILDPQPYILSVTNTTTTAGGADSESDDAMRVRIKAAPAAFSTAGSRQAYRYHTLSASALLSDAAVLSSTPGQVDIYPLMADGTTTPGGILSAVEDACNGEDVRPLSDTVVVASAVQVTYNLTANVTIYTGNNYITTKAAIEAAITEWAAARRQVLGIDITDTQVITVIHNAVPGVVFDVTLAAWSDIIVAANEFAKLNTLIVNIIGDTPG